MKGPDATPRFSVRPAERNRGLLKFFLREKSSFDGHWRLIFTASRVGRRSRFIVPMACFAFVAYYGFNWPKFSHADSLHSVRDTGAHA